MKKWLKLIGFIYVFIFSIELIKQSSLFLAPNIKDFLMQSLTPIKALSVGWFVTSIVQSSGAVGTVAVTFAGNNLINLQTAIFILIGALFGTTITAIIISIITIAKKRRDFRHGFEIGLCYSIYSACLVAIIFPLEYFLKLFSRTSFFLASFLEDKLLILKIPDFIGIITSPILEPLFTRNHKLILLIIAFALLIVTLKYIGKSVIDVLGGEEKARNFINRHFESKYKAYFTGVILTGVLFSSSITIGLLVPLAVSRIINLKKAVPFILGANLGTFTDIFLASVILGKTPALAVALSYFLFAVVGTLIFLPNTELLFRATKFISKRLIHISRKKALYFLMIFIIIPLLIILIS